MQAQADSYAAAAAAFASTTDTPWAKYEAERAAAVAQYYQDTLDDYVDEVAAKAEAARKERIEQAEAAEKANNDTAAADAARLRSDADALLSRAQSPAALANQRAALGMEGRVAPNLPAPPASAEDSGIAGVDASVFTAATDHAYHAALIGQMFSAGTTTGISLDSYTSHTPIDYALPQHWFWAGWSHLYGPHNWSDAPPSPTPVTAGRLSGNKLRENLLDTYGSAYDAWDGATWTATPYTAIPEVALPNVPTPSQPVTPTPRSEPAGSPWGTSGPGAEPMPFLAMHRGSATANTENEGGNQPSDPPEPPPPIAPAPTLPRVPAVAGVNRQIDAQAEEPAVGDVAGEAITIKISLDPERLPFENTQLLIDAHRRSGTLVERDHRAAGYPVKVYAIPLVLADGSQKRMVIEYVPTAWTFGTSRYRLAGIVPITVDPDSAIAFAATDAHDLHATETALGIGEFLLHLVPVGAAADYAAQGNWEEATISIAGDVAMVATGGMSKAIIKTAEGQKILRVTGVSIEGSIAAYRGGQGAYKLYNGDGGGAELGEALLRVFGIKLALKKAAAPAARAGNLANGAVHKVPGADLRQLYTNEVAKLEKIGKELLAAGKSEAEVARTLHQLRRSLGVKYKEMTPPDLLGYIYKFNEHRYGDKLGPTLELLKSQGKTDAQIIAGAARPLGDMKELGSALYNHFGDEIIPILRKYGMLD